MRESLCLEETGCADERRTRAVLKERTQDSVEKNYRRLRYFDLERVAERMRVIYDRVSLQEQGSTTGKSDIIEIACKKDISLAYQRHKR